MKKLIICLFILVFLSSVLSAAVTDKKSETLSLVLPADTLTIGLKDVNGNTLDDDDLKFYLIDHSFNSFTSSGFTVPVSTVSTDTSAASTSDKVYAFAAVYFRVYWEALVSTKTKLVVTVPEYFYGTSSDDKLEVMKKTLDVVAAAGDKYFFLTPGDEYTVQKVTDANKASDINFDSDKIYSGYQECVLVLNIKDAKLGSTYSGEIEFKVVTQ